jgi:hypothetical protein
MTNTPARLDPVALKVALDAVEALLQFRAFTPGPMLVMLLGRFRDDLREDYDIHRLEPVPRGTARLPLSELGSIELDTARGAVIILLQDRFTAEMTDPALPAMLEGFQEALKVAKTEQDRASAEMTQIVSAP